MMGFDSALVTGEAAVSVVVSPDHALSLIAKRVRIQDILPYPAKMFASVQSWTINLYSGSFRKEVFS